MGIDLIPVEFQEKELFNKFIQTMVFDKTYIGEDMFPVRVVFSTHILDAITNASYEVFLNGVRNRGDASYNIDQLTTKNVSMEMFDYILDLIFTGKDFDGINGLGGISFIGSAEAAKARQVEIENWIMQNVQNMVDAIRRFWEYARWSIVLNGGILDLKNNARGIHFHYDFKVPAALKVAANTLGADYKWDNNTSGKSDPMSDIEKKRIKLKENGARGGFEVWGNPNTWQAFASNSKVITANVLSDRMKDVLFGGSYEPVVVKGCQLKVQSELYQINENGTLTTKYYLPDGYIILKSIGALGETQYGTSEVPTENNIQRVVGIYSYSEIKKNPASMQVVAGVKGAINYQYVNDALVMKVL